MYEVTKRFTGGLLAGIEHTSRTRTFYRVGWECKRPVGGSPYVIVRVVKVGN